jgi:sugar phosphate permease
MMPQAFAAMSLKMTMPGILARFGYRTVLISNTLALGALIMLFATIGAATPVWLIVLQSFIYGFFQSLQFTSMNTLVYADVSNAATGDASSIASTAQQLSMSFGVAAASLVAAWFVPDRFHTNAPQMMHGIHQAFVALGGATVISALVFSGLRRTDGSAVSQHRTDLPAA